MPLAHKEKRAFIIVSAQFAGLYLSSSLLLPSSAPSLCNLDTWRFRSIPVPPSLSSSPLPSPCSQPSSLKSIIFLTLDILRLLRIRRGSLATSPELPSASYLISICVCYG